MRNSNRYVSTCKERGGNRVAKIVSRTYPASGTSVLAGTGARTGVGGALSGFTASSFFVVSSFLSE